MKKNLLILLALVFGVIALGFGSASADAPALDKKVYVCKYVGKPGVDERLQTGDNPIWVSENAIPVQPVVVGAEFADKQGRSVVIQIGGTDPGIKACPAPTPNTTTTTQPPVETTQPPTETTAPPVETTQPPVASTEPPTASTGTPPVPEQPKTPEAPQTPVAPETSAPAPVYPLPTFTTNPTDTTIPPITVVPILPETGSNNDLVWNALIFLGLGTLLVLVARSRKNPTEI